MTACVARNSIEMLLMCFFPTEGGDHFFTKGKAEAMRNSGNVTLEPCDKADDAKYSFPKGAINKKYNIF